MLLLGKKAMNDVSVLIIYVVNLDLLSKLNYKNSLCHVIGNYVCIVFLSNCRYFFSFFEYKTACVLC